MLDQIDEMVKKEEKILLPMSLKTLTPEEWAAVHRDSFRFGFCLVEPGSDYHPPVTTTDTGESPGGSAIAVGAGHLTPDQLRGLVTCFPSISRLSMPTTVWRFLRRQGPDLRPFPSIIGRKVQNCHPPQSVSVVEKILSDFRSGTQDVAEFWINLHGRFVHIRYFAVRGAKGEYLGRSK